MVAREYSDEERFLARRLAAQVDLRGPLVEDEVISTLADKPIDRLLDVGCGTGDYTQRVAAELGCEVVVVDVSERMVELTRARRIDARVTDIQALPFEDDSFDAVLANRVLYHVPDLERGLAELARVLRPGGRLVAVTYSEAHLAELWAALGRQRPGPTPFTAENAATSLRRHFAEVESRLVLGEAVFATVGHVGALLEAHGELEDLSALLSRVGGLPMPFRATYRHGLLVAHKGR